MTTDYIPERPCSSPGSVFKDNYGIEFGSANVVWNTPEQDYIGDHIDPPDVPDMFRKIDSGNPYFSINAIEGGP